MSNIQTTMTTLRMEKSWTIEGVRESRRLGSIHEAYFKVEGGARVNYSLTLGFCMADADLGGTVVRFGFGIRSSPAVGAMCDVFLVDKKGNKKLFARGAVSRENMESGRKGTWTNADGKEESMRISSDDLDDFVEDNKLTILFDVELIVFDTVAV